MTSLLERQITEFRYCFPFGRPDGALERTLSLLERVCVSEPTISTGGFEMHSIRV
ncbi:unnamed protein product [Protopolystoma xenopodis]|uniref:Uncharacterized protein n=1 Tax=Protopolystoma xenopodis TaxID=117903 RepID=A0A448WR09_9PLAT|nr:unnamed protein product [Protopolystoma xenopodis]